MDGIVRFGVSLPVKLLERFDRRIEELGYDNRSKAICDAISDFLTHKDFGTNKERFVGSISFVYNHKSGAITHKLTEIQHDFDDIIKSAMHVHIGHERCIEVLILSGKSQKIERLYKCISTIRGVENCKLSVLAEK